MPLNICHPCQHASLIGKRVAHVCTDKACVCSDCLSAKLRRRGQQRREAQQVAANAGISR